MSLPTISQSQRHRFKAPFKQSPTCTSPSAVRQGYLDCVMSQNNKQLIENVESHTSTGAIEGIQLKRQCINDKGKFLENVRLFCAKDCKNYGKKSKNKSNNQKTRYAKTESTSKRRIHTVDATGKMDVTKKGRHIQAKKYKRKHSAGYSEDVATILPSYVLTQTTLSKPINDINKTNSSSVEGQNDILERFLCSTSASADVHISGTVINQSGQRIMNCSINKMNKVNVLPSLKSMYKREKKNVTRSTTPKHSRRRLYNPNSGATFKGSLHQPIGTSEITDHDAVKHATVEKGTNKNQWPNIEHEFLEVETKIKQANSAKIRAKRIADLQVLKVIGKMRDEIRCLKMRQNELLQKIEEKGALETVSCGHPPISTPMLHVEVTSADRKGRRSLQIKQSGSRALETIGAGYGLLPSGQLLGNEF